MYARLDSTMSILLLVVFNLDGGSCAVAKAASPSADVDMIFILDSSESVTHENFHKMCQFVKDVVSQFDTDSGSTRVGVLTYRHNVTVEFHLDRYSSEAETMAAIDQISYIPGSTNTSGGLKAMHALMFTTGHGDRVDAANVALLITDGLSDNRRRSIHEATSAHEKGIRVFSIGVGEMKTGEITAIASPPSTEHCFHVLDFDSLKDLINIIYYEVLYSTASETFK